MTATPAFTITHTISSISTRHALFGTKVLYFLGSTNTATPSISNKKAFTIDFQDGCRTSSITAKTITTIAVAYNTLSTQTVAAFTDSLAGGSYSAGICGELRIALVGAPSWLSITPDGSDPAT